MKVQLCGTAVAIACAATLNAQDRPAPASRSAAAMIVVEGCLQNADKSGSLGGTRLGASATPPFFILTDARPAGRANASNTGNAVGTAGSARTRTADGTITTDRVDDAPKTYALIGNQNELAVHSGHRVEITGTVAAPAASNNRPGDPRLDLQAADVGAAGGANAPGADSGRATGLSRSGTERLTVASVRPLSNRCSQ